MIVRNATTEDVFTIVPADHFERVDEWRKILEDPKNEHYVDHYCRSFVCDERVVGMGGLSPTLPNSGEVWFLLSDDAYRHRVGLARHAASLIHVARELIDARRLTSTLRANSEVFLKQWNFMERLGFRCETPDGMGNYLYEETYYQFARTF